MRALVIALVLAACGTTSDSTALPCPTVNDACVRDMPAPPKSDVAVKAIIEFYAAAAGSDISGIAHEVHWVEVMPAGYLGITRHTVSAGCSSWIIQGALWSYPKVLPHELGHCARWLLTGDGDAEHTDVSWWGPGGLVEQALAAEAPLVYY